jgi:single-strand DNA-binding protein
MNVFTFSGNLGRDCKTNNVGGTAVCNFAVAVKSGYGDKEQTLWLDCALWGKKAESRLPEYLLKGQQVVVSGELGTREHEGKTYLTCRVNDLSLVGKRDGANQQSAPVQQPAPAQQPQPSDDYDDDIPF